MQGKRRLHGERLSKSREEELLKQGKAMLSMPQLTQILDLSHGWPVYGGETAVIIESEVSDSDSTSDVAADTGSINGNGNGRGRSRGSGKGRDRDRGGKTTTRAGGGKGLPSSSSAHEGSEFTPVPAGLLSAKYGFGKSMGRRGDGLSRIASTHAMLPSASNNRRAP